MEHVVFFPAHDGSPAFRRVASLEEAVRLVEHLRNMEGVDDVSVHALTPVPLEFKAYYRVEMPPVVLDGPAAAVPAVAPAEGAAEEPAPAQQAPAVVPEQAEQPAAEAPAAAPAKASLGFFSRG